MLKNQLETFTDRHEAIALFDRLRGRDPEKPWPLLPILAFIAPGGSGKSTLYRIPASAKMLLNEISEPSITLFQCPENRIQDMFTL